MPEMTYTYRANRKVELLKEPDQFVVRAGPGDLAAAGFAGAEPVSPSASRVRTAAADLEARMAAARRVATTHHAYRERATGREFLITDRILVTFKPGVSRAQIDALAARY